MDGFITIRDGENGLSSRKGKHAVFWSSDWNSYNTWGLAANTYVWYNSGKEYWGTLIIIPRYIFVDYNIELRANGWWMNNDGPWYNTTLTYSLPHNGKAPSSVSLSRSNGKINLSTSLSGCNTTHYHWKATLFTTQIGATDWRDPTSSNSVGGITAAINSNGKAEIAADNYKPYTVYPRLTARYGDGYYRFDDGYSQQLFMGGPNLVKDYDAITVKGYPRAANVEVIGDKWGKKNKINWSREIYDTNNVDANGEWCIFRVNGDNVVNLGTVSYGTTSYNDDDVEYGVAYTYYVCFVPNGWTVNSWTDVEGLYASATYTLNRSFDFSNLTTTSQTSSVLVSWAHELPTNNTALTFKVWRVRDNGTFYSGDQTLQDKIIEAMGNTPVAEVPASSGNSTLTYEDQDLASNCAAYWYRISVEAFGTTFYSNLMGPAAMSGSTEITGMTANRGTYSNVVKVQWDVRQVGTDPTRYVVSRRLLGSDDASDYQQVYVTSGTESSYFFEDNTAQPGQFYQYRVMAQSNCVDTQTGETSYINGSWKEADGFCQSRGIISGRITYGTGTAVPNARVLLAKNSEGGEDAKQFYSMKVDPQGGIKWSPTATAAKGLFEGKAFTLQLYVRPDAVLADGSTIIDGGGNFAVLLKPASETGRSEVFVQVGNGEPTATGVTLKNEEFTNLSVAYDGTTGWTVRTIDKNGALTSQPVTTAAVTWTGSEAVAFGCDRGFTAAHAFTGYLDDIRLWSKALTDDDVRGNYDRLLIGTEAGLKIYWPMDEGVKDLPFAYDYSKTQGVANENHGEKQPNTSFSDRIPSDTQLGLYGKTDTEGNYVIRGIPFTGEGTNYKVSPDLGIHSFSPQYQTRFISMDALTHSGVDFEDVSSFKMSGYVYYENTNIPVEGAYLYVDGTICAKDGEPLVTDAEGYYEISVPIGDHYVTVKKDGHTFVNGGRYPADPKGTGTVYTFVKEETATFYDATKVMIAGRVVGGPIPIISKYANA